MADSTKLKVLKRLTALLEGIVPTTPTEPGLTTMAGRVFRGRSVFGDDEPATMLSILEAPRPDSGRFTGDGEARLTDWQLLIQGWCPDDKTHPSDPVYALLEDTELRLDRVTRVSASNGNGKYPEHYMLVEADGLITSFRVEQGIVRPPTPNISSKAFFYIPVLVGLARIAGE